MAPEQSGMLVTLYRNRIGEPNTGDEVYGYWLFVIGLFAGILGIVLFLLSESSTDMARGAGIMLGAFGLLLLIAGPIIRLQLRPLATYLTYAGGLVGLVAVGWFLVAYPDNWVRGTGQAQSIIGVFAVGLALIALGGVAVPLIGGRSAKELEAELEAERETRAQAESRAAAEQKGREAAEQTANTERTQRETIEDELSQILDSQSQFELYEDAGGEYRWRLRHRNTNVIATSGEGYSAQRKAQQGLAAVKRDASGASVVDIERTDADVTAADDATDGADAPEYVPDVESQATFEQYEDTTGEYRWRLVHENGRTLADGGEGYFSRSKAKQGIESVRKSAPDGGKAEFEVYEDKGGKYRWRLRHRNGEIIADRGQGYADERGATDAVERVRNYAPDAPHLDIGTAAFEIYEDNAEEWRWRLRSRNGNTLGDSGEGYGSRRRAEAAVVRVKRHAPNASADWQT